MVFDNTEVEIKVPLEKRTYARLRKRLDCDGVLIQSVRQTDRYFSPEYRMFTEERFPFEWLSIRVRGAVTTLNYKHFYPEGAVEHSHCDEYETIIEDAQSLEKIFASIDLFPIVTIRKARREYRYDRDFLVALDDVDNLGYFVEIEAARDFGDVESTRTAVRAVALELRLDLSRADHRGYPFRMLEKTGRRPGC